MKNIISKLMLALAILTLGACSSEDTDPRSTLALDQAVITTLSPTAINDIVLTNASESTVWQTFTFESNADLATVFAPQQIIYQVVIDKTGDNFDSPYVVTESSASPIAVTQKQLNKALTALGYTAATPVDIDVKVIARIGSGTNAYVSSKTIDSFNVTPYDSPTIPSLYMIGSINNWTPSTSVQLRNVLNADGELSYYEAYLPSAGNNYFRFVSNQAADWAGVTTQYGPTGADKDMSNDGTAIATAVPVTGADKAYFVTDPGLYYVRIAKDFSSVEVLKMNWGVIGSAIPITDWSSETAMTYDGTANTFTYQGALQTGQSKFRCKNAGDLIWSGEWKYNTGKENSPVYKDAEGGGGDSNFDVSAQAAATVTLKVNFDGTVVVTGF